MINLALVKSIVEKICRFNRSFLLFSYCNRSISRPTSFGKRATSTQERAGKLG